MWSIGELKEQGRAAFKANYWRSVLCGFLLMLLVGGLSLGRSSSSSSGDSQGTTQQVQEYINNATPEQRQAMGLGLAVFLGIFSIGIIVAMILKIFLFNPLTVGCYGFFRDNVVTHDTTLDVLKSGFTNYGTTFITLFLRDLFLFLWTLLLIIPGFVKIYSYRMVPYIIRDNPDLSPTDVITRSREMMNGNKWNAFVLDLSFIGWSILGIITLGLVQVFWTQPYKQSTDAALYLALKSGM